MVLTLPDETVSQVFLLIRKSILKAANERGIEVGDSEIFIKAIHLMFLLQKDGMEAFLTVLDLIIDDYVKGNI